MYFEAIPKIQMLSGVYNWFLKQICFIYFCLFLQIWMCGGKIYIVTCSRVGHVFRKTSPYSWPGGVGRIINHNTQRIVEVWMDDYKDFFYQINPSKWPCQML